jgi:hypothetical protein
MSRGGRRSAHDRVPAPWPSSPGCRPKGEHDRCARPPRRPFASPGTDQGRVGAEALRFIHDFFYDGKHARRHGARHSDRGRAVVTVRSLGTLGEHGVDATDGGNRPPRIH